MTISYVIAFVALLVAVLSALYARWTWSEARRANQISLLVHKKEVYDAFLNLKMHMIQKSTSAELNVVSKFYYSSKNARLYLSHDFASEIERYYDACFQIADIHRKHACVSKASSMECKPHIAIEEELAPMIENEFLRQFKAAWA